MKSYSLTPLLLAVAISTTLAACGEKPAEQPVATPETSASLPQVPVPRTPAAAAYDPGVIDTSISACQDFNGFVNAKWVAANPIPADRTRWGSFDVLREQSLERQKAIAEAASAGTAGAATTTQLVGALYRSGMDEAAIERSGFEPIKPELARIDALASSKGVVAYLVDSFSRGQASVFAFGAEADFQNSSRRIAYAFQGGLGLPTPDYYTSDEHAAVREAYRTHIARMLELIGVNAPDAALQAGKVLAFETQLAKVSFAPVELRDPANQYNFVSVDAANAITPNFDWAAFFAAQKAEVSDGFSLSQPKFFAELDRMIAGAPVADWQAYLRFHTADNAAPYLSTPFQQANFDFHKKTLSGQKEQELRWKRVLATVNDQVGMALGEAYVAQAFPPESKARALVLVENVQAALKARIEKLDWMSDATKVKALEKWASFMPKIGYPEKWRDWSGLSLTPDNYFANVAAAVKFNHDYDVARIGKPTDRMEWAMTPQTVNAYYNPTDNTINFPAAILQPPFFDANADDATNYGGIGAVIGHEATHGFDDQGSQFDAAGNNTDWWASVDKEAFKARTAVLVAQFNGYEALPGKFVNGELTLGENIADLGGLAIAYDALQVALGKQPGEVKTQIGGYSEDQRFFMNWARVWRGSVRDQRQEVMLNTDSHAPARFRASGAPSNLPAFAAAFECKQGDPMVRSGEAQVKIW